MKKLTTKKIVLTALFMALIVVATMFIRIPLPLGYVNLGDAFILLAVFILDPVCAVTAAGIGSALADLFGYIAYAPGTLIIKTAMAVVAYFIYKLMFKLTKKTVIAEIIAGIAGAVIMAFGYFFYEILFFETASVAILNVPFNLLQGAAGIIISVVVMRILNVTRIIKKDCTKEE